MPCGKVVQAQEAAKRDLARYLRGGSFDLSYGLGTEELTALRAKARGCLWESWKQKRLAQCVITFHAFPEGDPTISNFYVEPDRNGRWRIVEEYQHICCWFSAMEGKESQTTSGEVAYSSVERVEPISGYTASSIDAEKILVPEGKVTGKPVPEREGRQPHAYQLLLKREGTEGRGKGVKYVLIL
jgi:hypothetical protein